MQPQTSKNLDQRKIEARRALGGEKTNDIYKSNPVKPKTDTGIKTPEKKESIITPKKPAKNDVPQKKVTHTKPQVNKKDVNKAFLEKIRPKNKRGKPITTENRKKIERIVPQKKAGNKNYDIQTIRTFKSDIAYAVKKKNESLSQIIIKEKAKKEKEQKKLKNSNTAPKKTNVNTKNILLVVGILIAGVSGITVLYKLNKDGLLPKFPKKTASNVNVNIETTAPTTESLILAEREIRINILDNKENLLKTISNEFEKYNTNGIGNIYLYKTINKTVNEKTKKENVQINASEFASIWENKMPNMLTRSLGEKFMLGVYSSQTNKNTPFLILTTGSYPQTFAGMIKWEQSMLSDINNLFGIETTTQTNNIFEDRIINGKDVRILTDMDGNILILYSLIDKNTVIVTTNTETFSVILQKLNAG